MHLYALLKNVLWSRLQLNMLNEDGFKCVQSTYSAMQWSYHTYNH